MPACNVARGMSSTRPNVAIKASRGPGLGLTRRKGEAAVAHDYGSHAVVDGRRSERIPPKLSVEVGVKIDDARRDRETIHVEYAIGGGVDPADGRDASATDRHVAEE